MAKDAHDAVWGFHLAVVIKLVAVRIFFVVGSFSKVGSSVRDLSIIASLGGKDVSWESYIAPKRGRNICSSVKQT
jgi:hypothetical protein